jgi:hypothetical protein
VPSAARLKAITSFFSTEFVMTNTAPAPSLPSLPWAVVWIGDIKPIAIVPINSAWLTLFICLAPRFGGSRAAKNPYVPVKFGRRGVNERPEAKKGFRLGEIFVSRFYQAGATHAALPF